MDKSAALRGNVITAELEDVFALADFLFEIAGGEIKIGGAAWLTSVVQLDHYDADLADPTGAVRKERLFATFDVHLQDVDVV